MYLARWQQQIRKGTLEFLVLLCLKEQEHYGYSLLQQLNTMANLEVAEGTIYPLLNRLQKEAYIESRWQIMEKGPARKYYKITAKGQKVASEMYNAWQATTESLQQAWSNANG
ncbi:MAG: PadR family transcriptional regulator [Pseudomonadales bacterium]|nr:PadR family transcriptional regulator [Pseudomonadales bacterium]